MKTLFQKIFINLVAIFLASILITGIHWDNYKTLLFAAIVLALVNAFLRPFLKILLLPINVITLGIFGWFMNSLILYLTTLIVPGFDIFPFTLSLLGISFVLNRLFAYVVVSFLLNIITTITSWIVS
jgi:putative membrane protein